MSSSEAADPPPASRSSVRKRELPEQNSTDEKVAKSVKKGKRQSPESDESSSDSVDAKMCQVCKSFEDDDRSLLCDMCNDAYHTFCLTPPLRKIPRGDWYCPKCTMLIHTEQGGAPSAGTRAKGSPRTAKRSRRESSSEQAESNSSENVRPVRKKKDDGKAKEKTSGRSSQKKGDTEEADDSGEVNVDEEEEAEQENKDKGEGRKEKTEKQEVTKRKPGRPRKAPSEKNDDKRNKTEKSDSNGEEEDESSKNKRALKKQLSKKKDDDSEAEGTEQKPLGPCSICGRRSANELLVCDAEGCDNAFHTFCLNPPLPGVPSSKWYCPTCSSNNKSRAAKSNNSGSLSSKGTLLSRAKKEAASVAARKRGGMTRNEADEEGDSEDENDDEEGDDADENENQSDSDEEEEEEEEEEENYKARSSRQKKNSAAKSSATRRAPSRRSTRKKSHDDGEGSGDDDDNEEEKDEADEGNDEQDDRADAGGGTGTSLRAGLRSDAIDFNESEEDEDDAKEKKNAKKKGATRKPKVKKDKEEKDNDDDESGDAEANQEDVRLPENDGGALLSEFQRIVATPAVVSMSPSPASTASAAQSVMALDDILSSMTRTNPGPSATGNNAARPAIQATLSASSAPRDLLVAAAAAAPLVPPPSTSGNGTPSTPSSSTVTSPPSSSAVLRTSRDHPSSGATSPPPAPPHSSQQLSTSGSALHSSLNSSGEKLPAVNSGGCTNAPAAVPEKTVQVWKGGLRFDEKFVCNVMGYVKVAANSAQKPLITWSDPLSCVHSILPPMLPPPQQCTIVSLLPEKDLVAYNQLLATLDKNLWVAEAKLRTSHVFLMSSTQLPTGYTVPLAQKASSLIAINIPILMNPNSNMPTIPPMAMMKPAAQQVVSPQQQGLAGTSVVSTFVGPNSNAPPPGPWMRNMSFGFMGYKKEDLDRMKPLIQFLVSSSGVQKPAAPDCNIIVINPQHLHKIAEEKNLLECKLSSAVFLRGVKHLEDSAERKLWIEPIPPAQLLFPLNSMLVLLQTDAIMSHDNALPQILDTMASQAKVILANTSSAQGSENLCDWIVKIHPESTTTLNDLKATSQRARKALDAFEKHSKTGLVENILPTEESHTYNSAWAQLPASFRNAMKMSYQYAARFRHVVLVTQQTELQNLARAQQLLAFDLLAFGDFVTQQIAKQYAQPKKLL